MQRRKFLKDSGKIAIGIGVFGAISWENNHFVGDTPTTSDILGPFYRPNAPLRTNINPPGYSGKLFHLSGTIFKEDGKTPFRTAVVEIWQCDSDKVYDNTSDDYRYRGTQKVDEKGRYHFTTCHPVPYAADSKGERYRPAHIHMRISGDGQQDLVTQVYFKDDPYLEKDRYAGSPKAVNRILPIQINRKGEELVRFDIVMAKEFKPSDAVFEKICGIYQMSDNSKIEYQRAGDSLFVKFGEQIGVVTFYKGNNEFEDADGYVDRFELQADGSVNVYGFQKDKKEPVVTGVKAFKP
jgi:protocatechuate 3,4-dioxygenase beta subunit